MFDARAGDGTIGRRGGEIGTGGRLIGGVGPRRLERDVVGVRVGGTASRLGGVPAHLEGAD